MASIFISYSHRDLNYARDLATALQALGHEPFYAEGAIDPGQSFREILSKALREADAIVFIVSKESEQSRYVQSEIGAALGYFEQRGRPLLIPLSIDETEAPPQIRHIRAIFARNRKFNDIASEIAGAVERAVGQAQALQEKKDETRAKVESTAETFITASLEELRKRESRYSVIAYIWYGLAYATLLFGLGMALWRAFRFSDHPATSIELLGFVAIGVVILGLLLSIARFAFVMGKSFMVEALRNSDRIHAISFGEFYLKAFPEQVDWEQLKDAFQHWNIDKGSSFLAQNTSEFDPEVFKTAIAIAGVLHGTKK